MTSKDKMKQEECINKGFARGLAYAIALLSRDFDRGDLAEYLFKESGLSYEDFVKAHIDSYDLDEIKKVAKK
jgi:hypothetical protein